MRRSDASSRTRGATGLTLGVLVAFIALTVGFFVLSQKGGDTKRVDSASAGGRKTTSSTVSTTTTTTRAPVDYTVQAGDTLTSVAKQYGVSRTAIIEANQIPDPDRLVPGDKFRIPSPTPIGLVVRPTKVKTGGSVDIRLKGAQPEELVTFVIVSPVGQFAGPAHSPDAKGTVTTTYRLGIGDPPGTYTVLARGDQVTQADVSFLVVAPKA